MAAILKNAHVYSAGGFAVRDVCVDGLPSKEYDLSGKYVFPGFTDVHVHFRQPGYSYKETIKTGSLAAARGGYARVFTMPNLNPVPDSLDNLKVQLDVISRDAAVEVVPFGSITKGEKGLELSDMAAMAPYVCGYSDDGVGVQSRELMLEAMKTAKSLGKVISAHCEDNTKPKDSPESEWSEIERNIELSALTGCAFHACHISTKKSVELIRAAKKDGLNVTCETAPHYIVFDETTREDSGRFKMNPPLRSKEDRIAIVEGVADGTIDMIATDHAPHSEEEKSGGYKKALNGIVGLETAFASLYTHLVKTEVITLERLVYMLTDAPSKRFGYSDNIEKSFTVFDLDESFVVNPDEFLTMGRYTPFDGQRLFGVCKATVCGGSVAWGEL